MTYPSASPVAAAPSLVTKQRVKQVFAYLEELNRRRNPVVRQVREQPSHFYLRDLPRHPTVQAGNHDSEGYDGVVLRVGRANIPAPLPIPPVLEGWFETGGSDPKVEPEFRFQRYLNDRGEDTEDGTITFFYADDAKKEAGESYKIAWGIWADETLRAQAAGALFERLYTLYGEIEREGERREVVLGDGILNWRQATGGLHHPLLLQRLLLEFDTGKPEFLLREADAPVELYSSLFSGMTSVDGKIVAGFRTRLEQGAYHPLDGAATDEYLRGLAVQLERRGEFVGKAALTDEKDYPRISRDPVVFVRNRTLGFAQALQSIVKNIEQAGEITPALQGICGVVADAPGTGAAGETSSGISTPINDDDILFSKPANEEQRQIVRRLDETGAVLVQGPPGTGKTHTIANLIGHLLAQGKSVLVTSHTSKALKVVREQVVEPLRPLCVSVLDSEGDSRQQMESAVSTIVERSSTSSHVYDSRAATDTRTRAELLQKLREAKLALLDACDTEFRPLTVGGESLMPSEAARRVRNAPDGERWMPTPITAGAALPLSPGELADLYRTNIALTADEERQAAQPLPDIDQLPTPTAFTGILNYRASLAAQDKKVFANCWTGIARPVTVEQLESLAHRVSEASEQITANEGWRLAAIEAGRQGGAACTVWQSLVSKIQQVVAEAVVQEDAFLEHGPRLADGMALSEQTRRVGEITAHLERGKSLNALALVLHPQWREFQAACRIGTRPPQTLLDFQVLQKQIALSISRQELSERWQRQMTPLGAPPSEALGERPETAAIQYVGPIATALGWHGETWAALVAALPDVGFDWARLIEQTAQRLTPHAELARMIEAAQTLFPQAVAARVALLRERQLEEQLRQWEQALEPFAPSGKSSDTPGIAATVYNAVRARDQATYAPAYAQLVALVAKQTDVALRRRLLARLEVDAPAWAAQVRLRQGIHGRGMPPPNPEAEWLWRQLFEELEKRSWVSLADLQAQIEDLNQQLRTVTASLIENKAWAAQARRTSLAERQALVGYTQIIKRIGKGTGIRVPRLQAEARKAMADARPAVPVWIMPLSRVVESFDPTQTRFDVVIVDEASQLDAMGLIALYYAREVVVVGDDEQVSPSAVGEKVLETDQLIAERLQGIKNSVLWDGQYSIYDLAKSSFNAPVTLREHFRCVTDIIQFSNDLCYKGDIQPLRDASGVTLRPHVVAHRVSGAQKDGKTNEEEAQEIAGLVVAMTKMSEYAAKSIGVISLVGDEQVRRMETLIKSRLDPTTLKNHQVLLGTPSQFQGDERDVMLLSVVDVPGQGPLTMRGSDNNMYRQRFNVAASRARDQMWVVHSLDPATDLKPGDIRKRLIEHAQNPNALTSLLDEKMQAADSEFERQVIADLVRRDYKVTSQYPVGAYRIDIVVEGAKARLAVECDGDRFHTRENLEADLQRQALLERLGWTFVRIRGSVFFRDPQAALIPLYAKLAQMDVQPLAQAAVSETVPADGLRARVIARAAELRREWRGESSAEAEEYAAEEEPLTAVSSRPTSKAEPLISRGTTVTTKPVTLPQDRAANVPISPTTAVPVLSKAEFALVPEPERHNTPVVGQLYRVKTGSGETVEGFVTYINERSVTIREANDTLTRVSLKCQFHPQPPPPEPKRVIVNGKPGTLISCTDEPGPEPCKRYKVIMDDKQESKSFLSPPAQVVVLPPATK